MAQNTELLEQTHSGPGKGSSSATGPRKARPWKKGSSWSVPSRQDLSPLGTGGGVSAGPSRIQSPCREGDKGWVSPEAWG